MRPVLRIVVALGFTGALVGAAVMTASGSSIVRRKSFSHRYPADRAAFERPKVHGPAPLATTADTVGPAVSVDSLRSLARLLPHRVLRRIGADIWLLAAPVDVVRGAKVTLSGGTLELAPDTFLQARAGGTLVLRDMAVTGVDPTGRPLARAVATRAFLVGRDGGRLVLERDRIRDLGHLGVVSYGIALRRPGPGSRVSDTTIDGNYFGVFLSHAVGVVVEHNHVSHSTVYGIDPYGYSSKLAISGNLVGASGLHGIVLADHVSSSRVTGNTVRGARGHGIVLYRGSSGNLVADNVVEGSFDGIVLTDAPRNTIERNKVVAVVRFGVRLSGDSNANLVAQNSLDHALLGAYLYGGAGGNRLLDNVFADDREDVRVRADAPRNTVSPRPPLSEGVH
jgi:parallel beta-helix repeat protein